MASQEEGEEAKELTSSIPRRFCFVNGFGKTSVIPVHRDECQYQYDEITGATTGREAAYHARSRSRRRSDPNCSSSKRWEFASQTGGSSTWPKHL